MPDDFDVETEIYKTYSLLIWAYLFGAVIHIVIAYLFNAPESLALALIMGVVFVALLYYTFHKTNYRHYLENKILFWKVGL